MLKNLKMDAYLETCSLLDRLIVWASIGPKKTKVFPNGSTWHLIWHLLKLYEMNDSIRDLKIANGRISFKCIWTNHSYTCDYEPPKNLGKLNLYDVWVWLDLELHQVDEAKDLVEKYKV